MLRFTIHRQVRDAYSGLEYKQFETVDCSVPELENVLSAGGLGPSGYDYRSVFAVEVLPNLEPQSDIQAAAGGLTQTPLE